MIYNITHKYQQVADENAQTLQQVLKTRVKEDLQCDRSHF